MSDTITISTSEVINLRPPPAINVTCGEVDNALAEVAHRYPELEQCMKVARAMLCRLDTIRDEAKFGACIALQRTRSGDAGAAAVELDKLIEWLGQWDQRHELML